jgi:hypothetical protein
MDWKMKHPQMKELREMLQAFFDFPEPSPDEDQVEETSSRQLFVYEPESRAWVMFAWQVIISARAPMIRAAEMHFVWPCFGDRERELTKKLGLPAPLSTVELPAHLRGDDPLPPYTVCPVKEVEGAASLCLGVLHEVFGLPYDRWLWITDKGRHEWPNPLPKPAVGLTPRPPFWAKHTAWARGMASKIRGLTDRIRRKAGHW